MAFTMNTSGGIIDEVRWLLNDRAASDNLASYDRVKHIAHHKLVGLLEQIGYEVKFQTINAVNGTQDYILSAGVTTPNIFSITTDINWPLQRISWQSMVNLNFVSGSVAASGDPRCYATYENTSGETVMRMWPVPNRTGTQFKVFYSSLPNSVNSAGDGWTAEIAGPVGYLVAKATAIEILAFCSNDIVQKRGLSKDVIPLWQGELQRGIKDEITRRNIGARTQFIELGRRD